MVKTILLAFSCFAAFITANAQTTLFDRDWKFFRGGAQRAEMPEYDDRNGEHSLLSNDPILNGLKSAFAIEDLLIVLPDIFVLTASP